MTEQQAERMIEILEDIDKKLDDDERLALSALEIPRIREQVHFIGWKLWAVIIICSLTTCQGYQ